MKRIFITLTILICCKITFAQISIDRQVIGSIGNYTDAGTVKASSTVGETVTPTYSQTNLVVTQGFQQPVSSTKVIDIFNDINEIEPEGSKFIVYPNPTANLVVMDITINQPMNIGIDVYNEVGQLMIIHKQIMVQNNSRQEINFSEFSAGNYFIMLKSTDGKLYKGFKVQKMN